MNMRKKLAPVIFAALAAALIFVGCRERIVWTGPGDWLLLATDPDDGGVAYNADSLFLDADFTDGNLMFKIGTYATIPNAADSVLMAVYFDTDQNAATGLSASTPGWGTDAKPQSIGADYMMFVGSEVDSTGAKLNTNRVFTWNSTSNIWDTTSSTALNPYIPAGPADSVIGGISEATLGNPSAVDVEVIFICALANTTSEYRDHVPNSGYATINLASDSIIPASSFPAIVAALPSKPGSQNSLITGKPRNLGEGR